MDSGWVSVISAALHSKAYKTSLYVAARSYCEIFFNPEIIQVNHNINLEEPLLYTDAIFTNINKQTFSTAKFILPLFTPHAKTSSYRISFNNFHDVCIVQLREATYNTELLAQALSLLSSYNDDAADPFETLDLDAMFGGSATDLEDEYEDATAKAVAAFHHLNFLGHPVYHKSSTPAEVSFWLAVTSHKKQVFHGFSRQGVINSQATKLMDPFVYLGPELGPDDIFELSGTDLTNVVAGHVKKAYAGVR
ncbi:hypothetical protein MMC22_002682, partial [Lobaria immixta]|nr:hypothetical protein [Lobaria immixta]